MARRTKEEALATRNRLLDAAELLFQAQGVSQTTLQQIAQQAGATR
ncbi:TetR family transcriptional regulator, partial [Variovorax sp. CT11-76]